MIHINGKREALARLSHRGKSAEAFLKIRMIQEQEQIRKALLQIL